MANYYYFPDRLSSLQGVAIVDEEISSDKDGRVRFQGTYWPACCYQDITLTEGQKCQVVGRYALTLIVEPISASSTYVSN